MKTVTTLIIVCLVAAQTFSENYLLNGGQESQINYQMVQKVDPSPGTERMILSYVVPESYSSPTFNQKISNLDFNFTPQPSKRKDDTDDRGNKIIELTWKSPKQPIMTTISLTALNSVRLQTLQTNASFPLEKLPSDVNIYLKATEQVSSDNNQIRAKARELATSCKTEYDAVQKILTWVIDHMHYVLTPESYNSTYSFQTGKGNCQNYSHLSAALMRAVGIPARIVNGITLKQPYDIKTGSSIMTLKMAEGRHSWIEVYFPDLGWVPLDPQQTELYVSNRFIRVEVGLDNNETNKDGLIRWTRGKGSSGRPQFEESINAGFAADHINISAQKMNYGPRGLLLGPQVDAAFTKVTAPVLPPPKRVPEKELKQLSFSRKYTFGNLEFPENVDFLSTRGPAQQSGEGLMEMRKNFLVETAEYVTTQGQQYAQTFILEKPMKLQEIGLALHKFGGDGQLWLELLKDDNGKPGEYISTSEIIALDRIGFTPGYTWHDFQFNDNEIVLSPGRYWIALGFTGSPIVNWFFTYGKPVGPEDGTKYRTMFDETWSRSLAFEFNYRVTGLISQ